MLELETGEDMCICILLFWVSWWGAHCFQYIAKAAIETRNNPPVDPKHSFKEIDKDCTAQKGPSILEIAPTASIHPM